MIDDDGGRAALRLSALARIVDDEGIEMRQRSEDRFGITGFRQRQCLARQPFQIAMLAHVDHRIGAELFAQEGIEGEIAMRRHEIGRVIAFLRIDIVAACRLDADEQPAETRKGERKSTLAHVGIGLRIAPSRVDFILNLIGKRGEEILVSTQGKPLAHNLAVETGIGRPGHQMPHERIAIIGNIGERITSLRHRPHHLDRPGGRIEPDAIAEPSVPVRIVRHDQRDTPL